MEKNLKPDEHQQEDRADQSKALADLLSQELAANQPSAKVTFKGEAIEISSGCTELIVVANSDSTYSINNSPHHISAEETLAYVMGHLKNKSS